MPEESLHRPTHPVRVVTAAGLFDGHDAAINIIRRLLQAQGCEVIHLGHNRSVEEVVTAAVQEDVQAVAVSSYQGGHMEYFGYLVDRLREVGAGDVRVYGGGGGVIVPAEIEALHARGVARIFSPEDGQRLGLSAMVNTIVRDCDVDLGDPSRIGPDFPPIDQRALARTISCIESDTLPSVAAAEIARAAASRECPVLGITGTGGSGKSSLTDELVLRFRLDQQDKLRIAVLAVDPTRRRSGGALLGDRIRMNSLGSSNVYFRSLATRSATTGLPHGLGEVIAACRSAGFDLVIVETPGIGQGDSGIVPLVDLPVYVMTPEYGAASQLEKIDMLDFAEVVAINKFERRGAEDALRDVRRQVARNRGQTGVALETLPVFGTIASRFGDDGVTALYQHLRDRLGEAGLRVSEGILPRTEVRMSSAHNAMIPTTRARYLADVADVVRHYHATTEQWASIAHRRQVLDEVGRMLSEKGGDPENLEPLRREAEAELPPEARVALDGWPDIVADYSGDEHTMVVRDREMRMSLWETSLSGTRIPKVALPRLDGDAAIIRWLRSENLPGRFPFTAGVFPFKRTEEDPARMFAGEGDPFRTNRRFHLLADDQPAARLSTAFDSVTLYGADPDERPDVYGKVGNSGVSVATLDDMRALYAGFDLSDPRTSVSMTINGPAPAILAMYFNTAIDQQVDLFVAENGREPAEAERADIAARTLGKLRGTVQADILKEDQGQNTCIFSTEFALRMMGDIQAWFIEHGVREFYSVSISGYHIAEAGANPISQLAFTLANGLTYVEAWLARGMHIDEFAPNLSFFFSNGMDPEYTVFGRVARRIWAIAMRERYGAQERSQKLKYHVQTSGRSLHAQEMAFNDIRTTLQALIAIYDNCNSLHTNAFDEAVTTPTEESLRRAVAIQLIINKEWGLAKNHNPNQGSFIIDRLTELVEEAVLAEFDRLSDRGDVLGAMESGYQRGRIQDESMLYEERKHDGSLPIIGVNTFRNPRGGEQSHEIALARSTDQEKESQIRRLREFQRVHAAERPAMLDRLRDAAVRGDNIFAVLMDAVRCCTLGEISTALFEVGGQYRRNV